MAKLRDSKKIRLKTNPSINEIKSIKIGDIIFLDGIIYTAREGVYKRVLEDKKNLPLDPVSYTHLTLPTILRV